MAPHTSGMMLVTGELESQHMQLLHISDRRPDIKFDGDMRSSGQPATTATKSSPLSSLPRQSSQLRFSNSTDVQTRQPPKQPKTIIRVRSDGKLRTCLAQKTQDAQETPGSSASLSSASSSTDLCLTATPTSSSASVSEVFLDADDRYRVLAQRVRMYTERELYEFWP
jgi:hypothetical protein